MSKERKRKKEYIIVTKVHVIFHVTTELRIRMGKAQYVPWADMEFINTTTRQQA